MKLILVEDRTIQVTEQPITERQQNKIARKLAKRAIRIEPVEDAFGVIHLNALEPVTEVTVLRAFKERTDMPLVWHPAVGHA